MLWRCTTFPLRHANIVYDQPVPRKTKAEEKERSNCKLTLFKLQFLFQRRVSVAGLAHSLLCRSISRSHFPQVPAGPVIPTCLACCSRREHVNSDTLSIHPQGRGKTQWMRIKGSSSAPNSKHGDCAGGRLVGIYKTFRKMPGDTAQHSTVYGL